jgi:2-hydroxychromene-2-carboxylate isomerase
VKSLAFHFDLISPFAYLTFHRLPQVLEGCSYVVQYRPVLFAALLQAHANKGPAEIEPKRAWTFRHVSWLAHAHGIAIDTPAQHPFNPLALLRLVQACGPNRRVVEAAFEHVWVGGHDANDPQRLGALRERLSPAREPDSDVVKAELRVQTDQAVADGIFGVPTLTLEGRHFWGLDALPMVRAALRGDPWFSGPDWDDAGRARPGVTRRA